VLLVLKAPFLLEPYYIGNFAELPQPRITETSAYQNSSVSFKLRYSSQTSELEGMCYGYWRSRKRIREVYFQFAPGCSFVVQGNVRVVQGQPEVTWLIAMLIPVYV
jgi:hypothetical protein